MSVFGLAFRNIRGNRARSIIIALCVLTVVGFFVSTNLIVQGAQHGLQRTIDRLGADILVMPEGAQDRVESALLMGQPTRVWMSSDYLRQIEAVPGVAQASPQTYLESLSNSPCCSAGEMFVVVYDPATDFTVTPWLEKNRGGPLKPGEVIGGTYVFTPPGESGIRLYGNELALRGNLEPTGTGIDQTLFLPVDTARAVAANSPDNSEQSLAIRDGQVSAVLVKVAPGVDAHRVVQNIAADVRGMTAIQSPNLFGSFRKQIIGLLRGFLAISGVAWIACAVLIGLIFSMAASQRRQQIAVLRALGATRGFVFLSLSTEAVALALASGAIGVGLSASLVYIFRDYIAGSLGMPFLFPSAASFAGLFALGVLFSVAVVFAATVVPACRVSKMELATAMRE